jgi:ribose 5-phosphate isomerase A
LKANLDPINQEKYNAAQKAAQHIKTGDIIGLGSGSTTAYAIEAIAQRMQNEKIHILGIPTSSQAFQLAVNLKIPITTLEEHPQIDVTIDGADQLTPELYLIKGGGAALAREKIVATATKQNIIIADNQKKATYLGEKNQFVPIEVLPFALPLIKTQLTNLGAKCIIREAKGKLGPLITDNGNAVIDATFGEIKNPSELATKIKQLTGVVETGFFINLTDIAYIGNGTTVEKLTHKR